MIDDWDAYAEADGMEIYNVHATLQRKAKDKTFMLRIPKVMKETPERSFQELQELDPAILKKWDEINQKRPFAGIAGNDAHQNVSFFGYQLDPYPRAFNFVTTHVLAEELSQAAVLAAIKAGRCYVRFELELREFLTGSRLQWLGTRIEDGQPLDEPDLLPQNVPISRRWLRDGEKTHGSRGVGGPTGAKAMPYWLPETAGVYRLEFSNSESGKPILLSNHVRWSPGRP